MRHRLYNSINKNVDSILLITEKTVHLRLFSEGQNDKCVLDVH